MVSLTCNIPVEKLRKKLDDLLDAHLLEHYKVKVGGQEAVAAKIRSRYFATLVCHTDVEAPVMWDDRQRAMWNDIHRSRYLPVDIEEGVKVAECKDEFVFIAGEILYMGFKKEFSTLFDGSPLEGKTPDIAAFIFAGVMLNVVEERLWKLIQSIYHRKNTFRDVDPVAVFDILKAKINNIARSFDPLKVAEAYVNYRGIPLSERIC